MEIQPAGRQGASPSSSSSLAAPTTSSSSFGAPPSNPNANHMQSWWEALSRARSRIHSLSALLPSPSAVASLADSDRPARSLLDSPDAYAAVAAPLSAASSGSASDPLCQWLYDTFLSSSDDLRPVVLSFVPLLAGLYLSRVVSSPSPSLSGFEAVLLAIYSSEAKSRNGKPLAVAVPDLSLPSLYHSPRPPSLGPRPPSLPPRPAAGLLCPPLEPQIAVKSTKRACIVAVSLDCYHRKISLMPPQSKLDFCEFVVAWAGQDCACRDDLDRHPDANCSSSTSSEIRPFEDDDDDDNDEDCAEMMSRLAVAEHAAPRGCRVPLPWELLQPVLRILGHCLLGPLNPQEVKDAASVAARAVYARASHDLLPQAILASRSLIRLDRSSRLSEKAATVAAVSSASNPNTPTKPRKPEILLVSK